MISDSLKRFRGKRISDLGRFERYDLLEHYVKYLADEIYNMDPCPRVIVFQAKELQPLGVLSYFHGLLGEKHIDSQVRISNEEYHNGDYVVNLDEKVQEYIDNL